MTDQRAKIQLIQTQETLLITLYSKVYGVPKTIFDDPKSLEILNKVDYDFSKLKVPHGTQVTVCLHAKELDQLVKGFLVEQPDACILHMGAGLDSRFLRVDNGQVRWVDLDLPDVITLRQQFYDQNERYRMIASSAADLTWLDQIDPKGKAVMIIAEGMMMYLPEEDVRALLLELQMRFSGSLIAFDSYSKLTVRNINRHPSIKKTGAEIHWGVVDPRELECWSEGIKLHEEWFFNQSEDIPLLDRTSRFLFWLTGKIMLARRAHRILVYELL